MGCSSREPYAPATTEESIEFFMRFIESWRVARDITDFFLCGHSLGGYLSAIYATKFPQHVKKLLMLSPIGFIEQPDNFDIKRMEVVTIYDENGRKLANKGPP